MPILMLTTDESLECKRAGREAGATGWSVEPFDPDRRNRVCGSAS